MRNSRLLSVAALSLMASAALSENSAAAAIQQPARSLRDGPPDMTGKVGSSTNKRARGAQKAAMRAAQKRRNVQRNRRAHRGV